MHHSEGVNLFYMDHLTAFAAGQEDERKFLEAMMAQVGGLVKELDIWLGLVSHLATPEGKPHEEGGRVMVRHFKGSRAIGYWSHYMIGFERNQQSEDENERRTTTVRILKDRYTGRATGKVFYTQYDSTTGTLFECEAPEEQEGRSHGADDF
jgi:twinkle protein